MDEMDAFEKSLELRKIAEHRFENEPPDFYDTVKDLFVAGFKAGHKYRDEKAQKEIGALRAALEHISSLVAKCADCNGEYSEYDLHEHYEIIAREALDAQDKGDA